MNGKPAEVSHVRCGAWWTGHSAEKVEIENGNVESARLVPVVVAAEEGGWCKCCPELFPDFPDDRGRRLFTPIDESSRNVPEPLFRLVGTFDEKYLALVVDDECRHGWIWVLVKNVVTPDACKFKLRFASLLG